MIEENTKKNENFEVILINPKLENPYNSIFPPFAYLFIAPKLIESGFRVKIFDNQIEDEYRLVDILKKSDPLWIGFTVMTGSAIKNVLKLTKIVKKYKPYTPIVFGGAHPTLLPEDTLKHPMVDIVVISEGELTTIELSEALQEKRDLTYIKGIGFKKEGKIIINEKREFIQDWDKNLYFSWDLIDFKKYINHLGKFQNLPFITSRGCPFRCSFCYNLKANYRKWRGWSAEKTIEEIKKIIDFGINYISFEDDAFDIDFKRIKLISTFLKENSIRWSLDNGLRVSLFNEEKASLFKDTNCDHLSFGAESGSQKILDYINKDITVEQIINVSEITQHFHLGAKYSWMIGFPNETKDDIWATLNLIDTINKINSRSAHFIGIFAPYPGVELVRDAEKLGWRPPHSLEEWSLLREEQNPPYIKDIWLLRAISISCYILFATETQSRTFSALNPFLKYPLTILRISAKFRWRKRFFSFPIEYKILMFSKNFLSKIGIVDYIT